MVLDALKSRISLCDNKPQAPGEHYARSLRDSIASLSTKEMSLAGTRSPPLRAGSPRTKFPNDQLRPYVRQLLTSTLSNAQWDGNDKARMGAYSKEICELVKKRMIELEPKGFKYIVTSTFTENLGQAGRADMACHWEETDSAVQEIFSNETIIFVCIAYAVRVL